MVSFEEIRSRLSGRPSAESWDWLVRVAMLDYDDRSAPREAAMDYILGRIERWPSQLRSMTADHLFHLCFSDGRSGSGYWGEYAAWLPTRLRICDLHLEEFRLREALGEWTHLRDQIEHIDLVITEWSLQNEEPDEVGELLRWMARSWMGPRVERLVVQGDITSISWYTSSARYLRTEDRRRRFDRRFDAICESLTTPSLAPRSLRLAPLPFEEATSLAARFDDLEHIEINSTGFEPGRHDIESLTADHLTILMRPRRTDLCAEVLADPPRSALLIWRPCLEPGAGLPRAGRGAEVFGASVALEDLSPLEAFLDRETGLGGVPDRLETLALDVRGDLRCLSRGVLEIVLQVLRAQKRGAKIERLVLPRSTFVRYVVEASHDPFRHTIGRLASAQITLCLEDDVSDYDSWLLEPLVAPERLERSYQDPEAPLQREYAWARLDEMPTRRYRPDLASFARYRSR